MIDHYNAFISYKHAPLDNKVAAEIQTRLERFRIPKAIQKSSGIKKINRIFRDKEELLITSDLNETIEQALLHSDFLIVICSHATKESIWVQREIEFFLKTHSKNQVLTVVAEGEPVDVVPQILQEREVTVTLDDGSEEVATVPMEPLSCDYRGDFRKARKEELPRLVAAMLGCSYDELKQRQRQYRMRRMIAAFSAAGLLLAGLSVYDAWSAKQIHENYIQSLRNQSQYLSAESIALLENGDRMNAMLLALEALPKDDDDERPVIAEAEYALSQAVNAYISPNENWYAVEYAFPHGGKINKLLANKDEDHLIVLHSDYAFTVWDVQTKEKAHEQILDTYVTDAAISYDDKLLLLSGSVLYAYNYRTGDIIWQLDTHSYKNGSASSPYTFTLSETAPVAAICAGDYLVTVDTATGQVLQEVLRPTYETNDSSEAVIRKYWVNYAKFSPDNQKLFLHLGGDDDWLALWDLKSNTVTLWDLWFSSVDDAFFTEDGKILMMGKYRLRNGNYRIDTIYYYENDYTELCCFDPEGNLLWADEIHYTEMDVGLGSECEPFIYPGEEGDIPAVAAVAGEKLNFYDIASGELLEENIYTAAIVSLSKFDGHFSAPLTDGMAGQYEISTHRNMAADFYINGIDLAIENNWAFVSDSETGNVLMYTYGLHDDNWTGMSMNGQIPDNGFLSFKKHHMGSKTLLTTSNTLKDSFVLLDAETRTARYYEGLGSGFEEKLIHGLSPDGSKVLLTPGIDWDISFFQQTNTDSSQDRIYEDTANALSEISPDLVAIILQEYYGKADHAVAAFDLETGVYIPDYEILPGGWSDLMLYDGTIYFQSFIPNEDDNVQQGVIRQFADGNHESIAIPTVDPEAYLISNAIWVTHEAEDMVLIRDSHLYSDDRYYYTANFETGEVFHTAPISFGDTSAVWSADGQVFFVTDENCIIAFDRRCSELYRISCNGMTVESMFASGDELFVLYGTDKLYRYRVSDGAFLNKIELDAGSYLAADCRWDDSLPGTLALFNDDTLNLIDTERWVVRTHVPDCLSFDLQENLIFTCQSKQTEPLNFGYYEIYDYKQLIEMAKEQLDGMTLSAEMRTKYGLQ